MMISLTNIFLLCLLTPHGLQMWLIIWLQGNCYIIFHLVKRRGSSNIVLPILGLGGDLFRTGLGLIIRRCVREDEVFDILKACHEEPCRGHFADKKNIIWSSLLRILLANPLQVRQTICSELWRLSTNGPPSTIWRDCFTTPGNEWAFWEMGSRFC